MKWIGKIYDFRYSLKDKKVLKVLKKGENGRYIDPYTGNGYNFNAETSYMADTYFAYGLNLTIEETSMCYSPDDVYITSEENGKAIRNVKTHEMLLTIKPDEVICTCIIPRHNCYWKNKRKEIVTNSIKVIWDSDMPVKKSGD